MRRRWRAEEFSPFAIGKVDGRGGEEVCCTRCGICRSMHDLQSSGSAFHIQRRCESRGKSFRSL